MANLHRRFSDSQVKELLERYLRKEIQRDYIQEILGIGKTRFFALINSYRKDPDKFSVKYTRHTKTRAISKSIEENIIKEPTIERNQIQDKSVPIKCYNYSYIKDLLENKYNQKVSLPTIIDRAKKNDFYLTRPNS